MSDTPQNDVYTVTELAALLNVARHKITYAVASCGVEPIRRAGGVRLWTADQIPAIRSALARTAKHPDQSALVTAG